jgi:hypothetical protein
MLFLALLSAALSAPQTSVRICIYDSSSASCPDDSTARFSIRNWDDYRAHEQAGFDATGSVAVTFYLLADLSAATPIELHLPALGVNSATFRPVGAERRIVVLDYASTTQARYFRFYNCFITVFTDGALYFYDLLLENSVFLEDTARLWAYNTLTVDLYSASALPSLSSAAVTLNFEKAFWPAFTEVIHLSRIVTVYNITIGGIDHALSMRIFGDMLLFQRPGFGAVVYLDIQEAINRPVIHLDRTGGQLTVYCDYYVPKFYDPPVLEFRLETSEPLIFGDSDWPFWYPNLILVSTSGRAGQNFWVRTPLLPVTVQTYWNISWFSEPVGDPRLDGEYLSELTIGLDVAEASILGQVQAQASDLHFDTRITDRPVTLTIEDFLEFGMELAEDPSHLLDKGVFPHIQKANMHVRFLYHEKHELLNASSKFGGLGTWEWITFPYTQGATGVGNLRLESGGFYDLTYGHAWGGSYGSALCELNPITDGHSSVTFSDPAHPSIVICPHYYYTEFNRPSNAWLEQNWPVSKDPTQPVGWPALLYFADADIPENAGFDIIEPEFGAPGFEQSTFFFDFIWDAEYRALRMIRKEKSISEYNYRFCFNPADRLYACPDDFAVIKTIYEIPSYVKSNAKTLRFALASDFSYDFTYFTNHEIDVRIFSVNQTDLKVRFNLTVPPTFFSGPKFGRIHLANLTLCFSSIANPAIEINETAHLDLHNITFDQTVIRSLQLNGCLDTPYISTDPVSYQHFQQHCIPEVLFLDEGNYHRIEFGQDSLTLVSPTGNVVISSVGGRPAQIELFYHSSDLVLDVHVDATRIPRTLIFQPYTPSFPNFTFSALWTPALASNLTIDNLIGRYYIKTSFVPFRPGGAVQVPPTGQVGIRIIDGHDPPGTVRIYYPFPNYAWLNMDIWSVTLRYEDIKLFMPMSPVGTIERAVFAGRIKFDQTAGINIAKLAFDTDNRPTIDIDFRLQGGLPRLYFGTVFSPMDAPLAINLIHRGASERAFIARHPDWFREFSHEIICGNASLPCEHWPIDFVRNETEDHTFDHDRGSSVLRTVCRPQRQGFVGKCLALEIEEYYFPLPTISPWQSPPPWPTPSHVHSAHTSAAAQEGYTANSGVGKGVGIGLAVGVVLIAVAAFLAYKFFGPSIADPYQVADLP